MKKKLSLLLIVVMVLSLTACASSTKGNEANETSVSQNVEAQAEALETEGEETLPESDDQGEEVEEAIEENYSIKDLFAEHGVKAGTCLTTQMTNGIKSQEIILNNFNSATMENAMKPENILNKEKSVEANDIVVEFKGEVKNMLRWAKENGIAMRGHTIVWYSQTPSWIFYDGFEKSNGLVSRDVMLGRMESYIKQVFEQLDELGYLDLFYAYDVVNEAWMEDGTMRDNTWKKVIGDDYIWYAFYYANKYAPEYIDLYYNDYNEQYKTTTLLKFVDTLVDDEGNYLIDGIGLQAHLYTGDAQDAYFRCVDALAEKGLKLQVTELDVSLGAWQKTLKATDENLATQGRYYYNLINGLLKRVDEGSLKMDSITFWGYSDGMSWRREASPLLFTGMNEPKPAYYGAVQVMEKAGFNK
ncbi:MAG: endo-1,4-beta-xylanase [Lachnospiraceae bacterium]|nr:endo-1,4-beta-xylanase [Lachnospiraceae bacterium]